MCGRFILRTFPASFAQALHIDAVPDQLNLWPRYNIAPTQHVAVVVPPFGDSSREAGHTLTGMRWGLIPKWMKEPPKSGGFINARSETVFEKPSFRSAIKYHRCLVPADGFYEWQKTPDGKQPYVFERPDHEPFCFAGIYEAWENDEGEKVNGVCILTTEPNAVTAEVHDRSPVVVLEHDYDRWTGTDPKDSKSLAQLLRPAPDDFWTSRPVSKSVNSPKNDRPELLD